MWARVGGEIGERLVRSALAPMLKFSCLDGDFHMICEEIAMEEDLLSELQDQKEKETKVLA